MHIAHTTAEVAPAADVERAPELVSYAISYGGAHESFSAVRYSAAEGRAEFESGDPYSIVLNDSVTKVIFNVSTLCTGTGLSFTACLYITFRSAWLLHNVQFPLLCKDDLGIYTHL